MYDPKLGRFITADPIGFDAGDVNLYRYVGNDPTGDTDPSGLAGEHLVYDAWYNYLRSVYGYNHERAAAEAAREASRLSGGTWSQNEALATRIRELTERFQGAANQQQFLREARACAQADQNAARAAAAAAAEAAAARRIALMRLGARGGLAGGLIYLAAQDPGPPAAGAKLLARINEAGATVETWELQDKSIFRRSIDVNGVITPLPQSGGGVIIYGGGPKS